jgi:16S rRNA (uracil1498-N3)-methyltransferase
MHRFYYPQLKENSRHISFNDPKELYHLITVLRFKKGDVITLFNGQGIEANGRINEMTATNISIEIQNLRTPSEKNKKHTKIILACAIPKRAKFEFIIEKCTELGVDEIIPLKTHRTEVIITDERKDKKQLRFETIAINAAKQCQRSVLPVIHPVMDFSAALKLINASTLALIPCLVGERKNLKDVLVSSGVEKIIYFIGPEGDFTPEEVTAALAAKCVPITLGETVLKVDTAAISVLAFLRFQAL